MANTELEASDEALLADIAAAGAPADIVVRLRKAFIDLHAVATTREQREMGRRDLLKLFALGLRQAALACATIPGAAADDLAWIDRATSRITAELGEAADAGKYVVRTPPGPFAVQTCPTPTTPFEIEELKAIDLSTNLTAAQMRADMEELLLRESPWMPAAAARAHAARMFPERPETGSDPFMASKEH